VTVKFSTHYSLQQQSFLFTLLRMRQLDAVDVVAKVDMFNSVDFVESV